ncbi:GNAT family N-acetyltransferase [Candidatus Hodarchaeum mangrovi]
MTFLNDLFIRTRSYENWFPDRFENSSDSREDGIMVWKEIENSQPKIVALTTRDSPQDFFLQVDPNYQFLEQEMIEWIEKYFIERKKIHNKNEIIKINILEGNLQREKLLRDLGYKYKQIYGYYRIRKGNAPIPNFQCPESFKIRPVKRTEFNQLAQLIRRVFGHGEWFTAEVLDGITKASFYRPELDLVAVNESDIIGSFCTFRVNSGSKIISLEPMGTNPDFRRIGLAKALLVEGFKRCKKYNPPFIYIDGAANTPAANQLYEITGFNEKMTINSWIKEI